MSPTEDGSNNHKPTLSLGPLIALGMFIGAAIAFTVGGPPLTMIFLAACALCVTIFFLWSSLGRMGEGARLDFEDALELAAPTATEEQKLAVLRALKDLEYELSVGKISREDFDSASAQYRAQARALIAAQDESMKEQLAAAEALVESHLKNVGAPTQKPQNDSEEKAPTETSDENTKETKASNESQTPEDQTAQPNDSSTATDSDESDSDSKTA